KYRSVELVLIDPNYKGLIDPLEVQSHMSSSVGLLSFMTVNHEIGTIQPIQELCSLAHQYGAFLHTDAAQAGMFLDLDVKDSGVDLMSISAHKIYGPKGIGSLFIRRDLQNKIQPLIHGGGQENGLRSGTLPTMLCVGFGKACDLIKIEREKNHEHLLNVSNKFLERLKEKAPNISLNGDTFLRHPGNINIQFPGFDAQDLLQRLQPFIAASTGSACTSGSEEPSHVLSALGMHPSEARSCIRFSFGTSTTEEDILNAVDAIVEILNSVHD
ncbi:MAG: cysteine desulfurase, partial [Micavibrio aeruginosavorus]